MSDLEAIQSAQPFFEQMQVGVLVLDAQLQPVWSNPFYREHIQRQLSVCDKHCFTGLQPGEARCEDCLPPQVQRTGRTLDTIRSARTDDGRLRSYRVILTPIGDSGGGVAIFMLPLPSEESESRSVWRERFLLSAIRNSNDAIFALDLQHTVRFWNQGAERLFGIRVSDVVGRTIEFLFPPTSRAAAEEVFLPANPHQSLSHREIQLLSNLHGPVWVEVSRTPLLDGSGRPNGYSFVLRDVTERRHALEKMAFTERMSAVGNMAAALAHEIGTPLGVISNNAEYALLELPDDDPRREDLQVILREAERIGGLVKELLDFSRPDRPEMEAVQTVDVLGRVERLVRHAARKQSIDLGIDVMGPVPLVHGDLDQLEQVVLNLTMNALQAIGREGRVRLAAHPARDVSGRDGVRIVVEDSGPGIDPAIVEKIFHPFFTTKANGTGLGLAVCKRIVEEHGGIISAAEGELGGAGFHVWLPSLAMDGSGK
jgi:two-component system nitrogen regulation sensor histidine kinase GlnL